MLEGFVRYMVEHAVQLACLGLVFMALERVRAAVPSQRVMRPGVRVDLFLSFAVILLCLPFYVVALRLIGSLLQAHAQFAWLYHFRLAIDSSGAVVQFLLALVVADFLGYWRHRLFHGRWLWPVHSVHHAAEDVDWLTNERFHPLDHLAGLILQSTAFLIVGFDPAVIAIHAATRRTYSMFLHANVRVSYGPLNRIFASPAFHRWHHAADARTIGRNFSTVFSAFDWMFGTWAMPRGEAPARYGLIGDAAPTTALGLLLHPFRGAGPGPATPRPEAQADTIG